MIQINIEHIFEIDLGEMNFESEFENLKHIVENDLDKFILSNKHLLKETKIYYDLIENSRA